MKLQAVIQFSFACRSVVVSSHADKGKRFCFFFLFYQIAFMNRTLFKISRDLHDANSKVMLNTKVDALQKGMADTGAEITKLSDEVKQMEKKSALQSLTINRINTGLWNISVSNNQFWCFNSKYCASPDVVE